jgi:hypothetical protein
MRREFDVFEELAGTIHMRGCTSMTATPSTVFASGRPEL